MVLKKSKQSSEEAYTDLFAICSAKKMINQIFFTQSVFFGLYSSTFAMGLKIEPNKFIFTNNIILKL
jgi:uncharacterized membrane protein